MRGKRPPPRVHPDPREGRERADAHRAAPSSAALAEKGAARSPQVPQPRARRGLRPAAPRCLCSGEHGDSWAHPSCEHSAKAGYFGLELPFCGRFPPFSLGLLQELRMDTRQARDPLTPLQLLAIFTLSRTEMSNELAQNLKHQWQYLKLTPRPSQLLTKWKRQCHQRQEGLTLHSVQHKVPQ